MTTAGDETGGRKDAFVFHDCVALACNTIPRLASIACDAVAAKARVAVYRAPLLPSVREVAAAATVASPTLYPEAVWRSAA